jgi:HSP20 family protein
MYLLRHNPAFYHGMFDDSAVLLSRPHCFATGKNDNKTVHRSIDTNATESDDQFVLTMDLPGVKADTLAMQVASGVLSISADRPTANGSVVAYRQRFTFDEDSVNAEKIKATLTDGVLTLVLPKKEEAKPIEVPVQEGEAVGSPKEDLRITFDVPGVKAADIKVVVQNGILTIKGERKKGSSFSRINRSVMLDRHRTDLTKPTAYLADGVLTFTAPHKELAAAKTIELNAMVEQPQPSVLVETVTDEDITVKL